MHHDFIDKYSRLKSPLHRAPAALKLALAFVAILAIVATPRELALGYVVIAALWGVLVQVSRVPWRFVLGRLVMLEPFVVGVALLAVLQPGGVRLALFVVVKSTLCLATAILLINTTPFASLLAVLRRLGLPALVVTVLALMYRYVFLLIDEAERMGRARLARSYAGGRLATWRANAGLIGQLFVRSTTRAERIYNAMCARGWQ